MLLATRADSSMSTRGTSEARSANSCVRHGRDWYTMRRSWLSPI